MATLDIVSVAEVSASLQASKTSTLESLEEDITALSATFDRYFGAMVQREATFTVNPARCVTWLPLWPIVGTPTAAVGSVTVRNSRWAEIGLGQDDETTVTATVGRYADTGSVAPEVKEAFVLALRNLRSPEQVGFHVDPGANYALPRKTFPTFAIPNAAKEMLYGYHRPEGIG